MPTSRSGFKRRVLWEFCQTVYVSILQYNIGIHLVSESDEYNKKEKKKSYILLTA